MSAVGLVVNPGASRDVRRLTSLARTVDSAEQTILVARVLGGLAAGGVRIVRYMPEGSHVVERARDVLAAIPTASAWPMPDLVPLPLPGDGYAKDAAGTTAASAALAEAGVACVITLGGDGTNRAVVAGWPDVVLVPLPAGTNNAFAAPVDPTAAGCGAARYAADPALNDRHVTTRPRLEIRVGGRSLIALVDLAVVRGGWVGAHAIWDPELLVEAVVARSDPVVPGLVGVAGSVFPLADGDARAMRLRFGPGGRTVLVQLGPGQLVPVSVRDWCLLGPGESVVTPDPADGVAGPVTLAFDGEREVVLGPGAVAEVRLVLDGPRVLDAPALLRRAAADGARHGSGPGEGR